MELQRADIRGWYTNQSPQRRSLLRWILHQPNPGAYGVALMRLQRSTSSDRVDLPAMLKSIEYEYIQDALRVNCGDKSRAAMYLSMSRSTFNYRLDALRSHGHKVH